MMVNGGSPSRVPAGIAKLSSPVWPWTRMCTTFGTKFAIHGDRRLIGYQTISTTDPAELIRPNHNVGRISGSVGLATHPTIAMHRVEMSSFNFVANCLAETSTVERHLSHLPVLMLSSLFNHFIIPYFKQWTPYSDYSQRRASSRLPISDGPVAPSPCAVASAIPDE